MWGALDGAGESELSAEMVFVIPHNFQRAYTCSHQQSDPRCVVASRPRLSAIGAGASCTKGVVSDDRRKACAKVLSVDLRTRTINCY